MADISLFNLVGKVLLDGVDAANQQLDSVGKKAEDTSSGLASKLGGVGPLVAGGLVVGVGAIVGLGAAATALGSQFDDAYDNIRVGTGATGTQLSGLEDDFKQVVQNVPASFADASTAISDLNTRLGLSGKPLQDMSQQMLNLSSITGTDLKTNIEQSAGTFQAWGVSIQDQGPALDYLFKVSQSTGIGIGDLQSNLQRFAPTLQQMGYSLDDSATLLGQWQKQGLNAQQMLSGMSIALATFSKEGKGDTKQALEDVVSQIKNAGSEADATSIAIQTFGTRAGPTMATNIRKGALSINDLETALKSSNETINKAEGDTEDFAEKWTKFKNTAMVALEPVANAVFGLGGELLDNLGPALQNGIQLFSDLATNVTSKIQPALDSIITKFGLLTDWISNHAVVAFKDLADPIQSVSSGLMTAGNFIEDHYQPIIAGLIAIILTIIIPAFYAWATAAFAAATGTIAAMLPLVALLAGIGIAVGLLYAAWQSNFLGIQDIVTAAVGAVLGYLGQFSAWFQGVAIPALQQFFAFIQAEFAPTFAEWGPTLEALQGYAEALLSALTVVFNTLFNDVITPIFNAISAFLEAHGEAIDAVLQEAWDFIKVYVKTTIDIISQTLQLVMNLIQGDWSGAWANIKQILQDVWDQMKALVQLAADAIKLLLQLEWDAIKAAAQLAWNGIKDLISGIVQALSDAIQGIANALKAALDGIWQAHVDAARAAWQFLSDTVTGIVSALRDAIIAAFDFVKSSLDGVWSNINSAATTAWNGIKAAVMFVVDGAKAAIVQDFTDVKNLLDGIWGSINSAATTAWSGVKKIFTDGKQAMQDAMLAPFDFFNTNVSGYISGAYTKIKGPLNSIIAGFETIQNGFVDALNWIFGKLGLGSPFSHLNLPRLAQGTDYAQGGLYSVAERGAELVYIPGAGWRVVKNPSQMYLPPGSKVMPASATQAALGLPSSQSALGADTQPAGRGGFISDVVGGVKNVVSDVASTVKDWASKGASYVIDKALDAVGVSASLPGVLDQTTGAMVNLIKDKIKDSIQSLIDSMNKKVDEQQAQAPVSGSGSGNYTGNNSVVKEAFTQLGKTMSGNYDSVNGNHPWAYYCEAFVESVGQHVGYPRNLYGSAQKHANSINLRGGAAPAGASAFWSWDTDGHVSISIGDGTYIGTSDNGVTVQGPGGPYLGWAPPGVANGGFFPANNPSLAWIGEGSNDEIVSPVPMLQQVIKDALESSTADSGLNVNFNGPVTIQAQDQDQANKAARDIGWATKQDLRARGLA